MFRQNKDGIFQITRGDSGFIYCINNKEEEIPTVKLYDTSDATATAGDIVNGKTAYTADGKVEGIFKSDVAGKIISSEMVNITADDLYGATKIADYKFYRDTNLLGIAMPNTVISIGVSSFSDCTKLSNIVIPDSVTTIKDSAFSNINITEIVIPDTVTYAGDYAFSSCKNLVSVKVGNGLSNIAGHLFYGSSNQAKIKRIDIGSGITGYIGQWAFGYLTLLETFIIRTVIPPTLVASAFAQTNNTFLIYVPNDSVSAYKGATNWAAYTSRIHPLSDLLEG